MAKFFSIALPVLAIGAAAFTGGASLGLFGADAGLTAADAAGTLLAGGAADTITGAAATADAVTGTSTLIDAGAGSAAATAGSVAVPALDAGTMAAIDAGPAMASAASPAPTILSQVGSAVSSASPYLKGIAGAAQIAGTVGQANEARIQASDTASLDTYEANIDTANANAALAGGSAKVQQQTRETAYAISNARAAAAAGGGSATDPTAMGNMMTIAGQGRLRALTSLYNAQTAQQSDLEAAAGQRVGATVAERAGESKELTTIVGGASSLYDKYSNQTTNNQQNSFLSAIGQN